MVGLSRPLRDIFRFNIASLLRKVDDPGYALPLDMASCDMQMHRQIATKYYHHLCEKMPEAGAGQSALYAALQEGDETPIDALSTKFAKRKGWDYGQSALVCAIEHENPHNATAYQYFMPQGPLAILPLTNNRSSIVWSETHERANDIMRLNDAAYLSVLRPRFGDFLGDIKLAGKRYKYPLSLSIAEEFVKPRFALIGDAAHGIHPIAGQGLNAGLKDIAALCHVLQDAYKRGENIGAVDVLERYQEWRRFDVNLLALATDGFNKLFSNSNALLRAGRALGLGLVNQMPKIRRSFIREAAGLGTKDLPYLMR